jgi:hypothetical protein
MKKQITESDEQLRAWMREFAALPLDESAPPDPALLWWKAELLRRWDAQRRTATPIEIGECIQVGVGLAGALTMVIWLLRAGLPHSLFIVVILSILILLAFATITFGHLIVRD